MPNRPIVLTRDPIDAACYNFLALLERSNTELTNDINNVESPKDIENCIKKEINLIKLLKHKIDTSSAPVKRAYANWGVKVNGILEIAADIPIIEAWINWYKHQRNQQLALIRQTEAYLPIDEDFNVFKVKYRKKSRILSINYSPSLPGTSFRIAQAEHYTKILHNILCAPTPPPPIGESLPTNYNKIHYHEIPKPRTEIGRNFFEPTRTFGQALADITRCFVNTAVNTGATSELLPQSQIENIHTYLPDDHPIVLATPNKSSE